MEQELAITVSDYGVPEEGKAGERVLRGKLEGRDGGGAEGRGQPWGLGGG